ncbi:MAG: carboxypeptidase regulatory-like domain-containing protein [Planctomycetes bacterium]|nr:carboxypeptidase regulatory-like domain-containing protein [Planctomycetota bacterium]
MKYPNSTFAIACLIAIIAICILFFLPNNSNLPSTQSTNVEDVPELAFSHSSFKDPVQDPEGTAQSSVMRTKAVDKEEEEEEHVNYPIFELTTLAGVRGNPPHDASMWKLHLSLDSNAQGWLEFPFDNNGLAKVKLDYLPRIFTAVAMPPIGSSSCPTSLEKTRTGRPRTLKEGEIILLSIAEPKTGSGRVISPFGQPISNVRVKASFGEGELSGFDGGLETLTSEDGSFQFDNLSSHVWRYRVNSENWLEIVKGWGSFSASSRSIHREPHYAKPFFDDNDIIAIPANQICVTVLDAAGLPLQGGEVFPFPLDVYQKLPRNPPLSFFQTDLFHPITESFSKGLLIRQSWAPLHNGKTTLLLHEGRWELVVSEICGNSDSKPYAESFEVNSSDSNVTLQLKHRICNLRIRLLNPNGTPAQGCRGKLLGGDEKNSAPFSPIYKTDQLGWFQAIPVVLGSEIILLAKDDDTDTAIPFIHSLPTNRSVEEVTLTFPEPARLKVQLYNEKNPEIDYSEHFSVALSEWFPEGKIRPEFRKAWWENSHYFFEADPDTDGLVFFPRLAEGKYKVDVLSSFDLSEIEIITSSILPTSDSTHKIIIRGY